MAKSYTLGETKHEKLFRLMDRDKNWRRYVLVKEFTEEYQNRVAAAEPGEEPKPTFADLKTALYLDGVTTILNDGYTKGSFFANWLSQHTMEEREKILSAAGEKGDKVHRTIDMLISGGDVDGKGTLLTRETEVLNRESKQEEPLENDEWDCLLSFESFWSAHAPIVLTSELTLYSTMFEYAGTADAIIILTKACEVKMCKCEELVGKIGLFDWKTSSGIRASYGAQVAAYSLAENMGEYLPPGQAVAYAAILRLGTAHKTTGGYELKVIDQDALLDAWQRFLGAKRIFDYEKTPFDPAKDIIDIPDEFVIHAPKFDMEAARKEIEAQMLQEAAPVPVDAMTKTLVDLVGDDDIPASFLPDKAIEESPAGSSEGDNVEKKSDGKHQDSDEKVGRRAKAAPRGATPKAGRKTRRSKIDRAAQG